MQFKTVSRKYDFITIGLALMFLSGLGYFVYQNLPSTQCKKLFDDIGFFRNEDVKKRIDAGADVNCRAEDNFTPLYMATGMSNYEGAKMLINAGADLEARTNKDATPLFAAVMKDSNMVKLLIDAGANVNALIDQTYSVYGFALVHNDPFILDMLKVAGANTAWEHWVIVNHDMLEQHGYLPADIL